MDVIDVLDVDIAWLIGDWECFVGSLSQALRACRLLESPRRPVSHHEIVHSQLPAFLVVYELYCVKVLAAAICLFK